VSEIVLVLVLVLVLGNFWRGRADTAGMELNFDHERLDVYRLAIEVVASVGELADAIPRGKRISAIKHLEEASTSIALNIAEGNGKRSRADRGRYVDIARGSAFETAACLDVLVSRRRLRGEDVRDDKNRLVRIVSMLTKWGEKLAA
jgi:four helix bundle protein